MSLQAEGSSGAYQTHFHDTQIENIFSTIKRVDVKGLHQRLTNFFCKGPGSKLHYFPLGGSCGFCHKYSTVPLRQESRNT